MADRVFSVRSGDDVRRVAVAEDGNVMIGDSERPTHVLPITAGEVGILNDRRVERLFAAAVGDTIWVFHDGHVHEFNVEPEGAARRRAAHQHGSLTAPMPATVIAVRVQPGQAVSRGEVLLILEAMKMELPVRATGDGLVTAVNCREGDLVQPGVSLIDLE